MKPGLVSNFLVSFVRVVGSTVVGKHSAVLVGGEGSAGSLDEDDEDDAPGERTEDFEFYSGLGLVVRPRPPEDLDGESIAAEALGLRLGRGVIPAAWRDLRLNRRFPAPKPGTIAMVGYGGGFLAFDDATALGPDGGKASKATWYVPYSYSDGVAQKAMVVSIDPDTESMMLIHGDGYAIAMDPDNGITLRGGDAETWFTMKQGKATLAAASIVLQGNVAAGANPTTAVALTAPSFSPSVFLSVV